MIQTAKATDWLPGVEIEVKPHPGFSYSSASIDIVRDLGRISFTSESNDPNGDWMIQNRRYYSRSLQMVLARLKQSGTASIDAIACLHLDESLHDQIYRDDDYRSELVEMGRLTATLALASNQLAIADFHFRPTGPRKTWRSNSVAKTHSDEIDRFLHQHL